VPSTVTLAQYATLEKEPLAKGIMLGMAMEGVISDLVSWRSTGGALSETGVRYDTFPQPDFISLDGSITTKSVDGTPLSYSVYQLAQHIDVPRLLEKSNKNQLESQFTRQTMLTIKGAAFKVNDTFINGDQASDANSFEGLNKLVADLGSSQTVGATEIDMTGAYSDALAESVFSRVDSIYHACEGHKPSAVFANDTFILKFRSFLRQAGIRSDTYDWVEAAFDVNDPRRSQRTAATRPAFIYQDVPWYDLGTSDGASTRIIGNAYAEGGSAAATRLFAVKFSEEDLEGIQLEPMHVENIGLLEDKDVLRKRFLWTLGLANWGPRSIVKGAGFKVA